MELTVKFVSPFDSFSARTCVQMFPGLDRCLARRAMGWVLGIVDVDQLPHWRNVVEVFEKGHLVRFEPVSCHTTSFPIHVRCSAILPFVSPLQDFEQGWTGSFLPEGALQLVGHRTLPDMDLDTGVGHHWSCGVVQVGILSQELLR